MRRLAFAVIRAGTVGSERAIWPGTPGNGWRIGTTKITTSTARPTIQPVQRVDHSVCYAGDPGMRPRMRRGRLSGSAAAQIFSSMTADFGWWWRIYPKDAQYRVQDWISP